MKEVENINNSETQALNIPVVIGNFTTVNYFSEEISTSCAETILGLESWIDGKEAFMEKLAEKLKGRTLNNHRTSEGWVNLNY